MAVGILYVVGTPIGNLSDFSPRALETLQTVDFIAAEDTRVTVKLLNHFGIKKPAVSYYEQNKQYSGPKILSRISAGENCALVTDAGMPAISDPGEDLVRDALNAGIPVRSVPGPSALISALSVSGMKSGRFCFEGFLSTAPKSRRDHLEEVADEKRTLIFYEAPHKLRATLRDFFEFFGDRKIVLVREITKIHEEIMVTTLSEARKLYADVQPKGEFVLILEGAQPADEAVITFEQAVADAKERIKSGCSISEAAKLAASGTPYTKSELYRAVIADREEDELASED